MEDRRICTFGSGSHRWDRPCDEIGAALRGNHCNHCIFVICLVAFLHGKAAAKPCKRSAKDTGSGSKKMEAGHKGFDWLWSVLFDRCFDRNPVMTLISSAETEANLTRKTRGRILKKENLEKAGINCNHS